MNKGVGMDAALISTWDGAAKGREQSGLEVFMDSMAFWQRQAENGKCEPQEVFLSSTGKGMSLIRGDSLTLYEILESDEWREIATRIAVNVDGWDHEVWSTGDEIQKNIEIYGKVIAAL